MSSRTWSVKTSKLVADKDAASIVLRLMMALNDIAVANEGLGDWTTTEDSSHRKS
jgi:hypothetical protein